MASEEEIQAAVNKIMAAMQKAGHPNKVDRGEIEQKVRTKAAERNV